MALIRPQLFLTIVISNQEIKLSLTGVISSQMIREMVRIKCQQIQMTVKVSQESNLTLQIKHQLILQVTNQSLSLQVISLIVIRISRSFLNRRVRTNKLISKTLTLRMKTIK
jgi:hypothetical protein